MVLLWDFPEDIRYGKWFPGESKKDLEDWCAKNCKPAKPAKLVKEVKEVKEEITPPIAP
jgi:hypothetical protein